MAVIAAKLSKIEEASKKKDEQTSVFINQTKEALDQKMGTHIEKRDAYISDIKTKLKDHVSGRLYVILKAKQYNGRIIFYK